MQPKQPEKASGSGETPTREPLEHRESHSRLSGLSNSLYSIGDLFKDIGRDGHRGVKFPEKLLKVLENKLQNIALGKDPAYTEQLTRRTVAVYWGSLKDPTFHRQMKDNRKIEELILMFVTVATTALKKDPQLSGDGWKPELENQIANFIRILQECLQIVNHVPPEITARVEMYAAKLAPQNRAAPTRVASPMSSRAPDNFPAPLRLQDVPLAQTVGRLFNISDQDVLKDLKALKTYCTEKAALADLKILLRKIHSGETFPKQEDFDSDAAYQYWRTRELGQLSQHMVMMVQLNPELAKSSPTQVVNAPRPESMHGMIRDPDRLGLARTPSAGRQSLVIPSFNPDVVSHSIQHEDDTPSGDDLTFVPPNPRRCYRRLLEIALDYDIAAMRTLPEDEEVSLGILSPKNRAVLEECALRWRVQDPFMLVTFLDLIRYKEEREGLPLACVPEALYQILKLPAE
jgi:hypothetical protein